MRCTGTTRAGSAAAAHSALILREPSHHPSSMLPSFFVRAASAGCWAWASLWWLSRPVQQVGTQVLLVAVVLTSWDGQLHLHSCINGGIDRGVWGHPARHGFLAAVQSVGGGEDTGQGVWNTWLPRETELNWPVVTEQPVLHHSLACVRFLGSLLAVPLPSLVTGWCHCSAKTGEISRGVVLVGLEGEKLDSDNLGHFHFTLGQCWGDNLSSDFRVC